MTASIYRAPLYPSIPLFAHSLSNSALTRPATHNYHASLPMACSLRSVAFRGCDGGSFLRQLRNSSRGVRATLSYYHKGDSGSPCDLDTDDELHPNWR